MQILSPAFIKDILVLPQVETFLLKRGKDYLYYYKLIADSEDKMESGSLLVKLLGID